MSDIQAIFDEDVVARTQSYRDQVLAAFSDKFEVAGERFRDRERLLKRFSDVIETFIARNSSSFRSVDEAHNELCIASDILDSSVPKFSSLEYEPVLPACDKSIDFRGRAERNVTVYVDVKTIKPEAKDRWDQFERALREQWFPENVSVILSQEWLGGELWHNMFAARSRMLEYTLELEEKIATGGLEASNTFFVLALCGDGSHWRKDWLEDFVSFYYSGMHRPDDPFAKARVSEKLCKWG